MNELPLLTDALLTGRDDTFIDHESLERPLHRELVEPWRELVAQARAAGFDLAIASAYRSYHRQLQRWNEKAGGERALLEAAGAPLAVGQLNDWQKVQAILRWSALPGTSRHHWGPDIDIYDRAALAAGDSVQLVPAEVADDGPFGPLHRWLDERIGADASCGFFRPYGIDRGGVAPERWHLSYAPLAAYYQRQLAPERLLAALDAPVLALRGCVRRRWAEIYRRYIWVPAELYPPRYGMRLQQAPRLSSGPGML
jgi:LAS superfamily LD-carboxypeptidase LdcB